MFRYRVIRERQALEHLYIAGSTPDCADETTSSGTPLCVFSKKFFTISNLGGLNRQPISLHQFESETPASFVARSHSTTLHQIINQLLKFYERLMFKMLWSIRVAVRTED